MVQNAAMDFTQAMQSYWALKARYEAGSLSQAAFEEAVNSLQITDSQGRRWQIGAASSKWYRLDGAQWVEDSPPFSASVPAAMPYVSGGFPGGGAPSSVPPYPVYGSGPAGPPPPPPFVQPRMVAAPQPKKGLGGLFLILGMVVLSGAVVLICLVGAWALVRYGVIELPWGGITAATATPTPTDEEMIEGNVYAMVDYLNAHDWDSLYGLCSPAYREAHSYSEWESQTVPDATEVGGITVDSVLVDVQGEFATAEVTFGGMESSEPGTVSWTKDAGQWYLECDQ